METRNFKTSFNLQRVREDSGLMKLFMIHNGFSNLSNSRFFEFDRLDPSYQTSKKREFDRLEKIWQFYQPSILPIEEKAFVLSHLRDKTPLKKNTQNQRAKLIF